MQMKLMMISVLFFVPINLFASETLFSSDCCRTLLTQASELIKDKRSSESIAIFIRVRDHRNAETSMIIQASKELMSHQLLEDALIGFRIVISRIDATESQLLHVAKILLEIGAIDLAKEACSKVLAYPTTPNTRKYIEELFWKYEA
jgi:hypothetical protein